MPFHIQDDRICKVLKMDDQSTVKTMKNKVFTLELMPPYVLLESSGFAKALSTHITHVWAVTGVGLDVPLHFLS